MKQVVIEENTLFLYPHCGECRTLMMIISDKNSEYCGWNIDYARIGEEVVCVSCKKKFLR